MRSCARNRPPHRETPRASERVGQVAEWCCPQGRLDFESRCCPRDGRARAKQGSAGWPQRDTAPTRRPTDAAGSRPAGGKAARGSGTNRVVEGDVLGGQLKLERLLRARGRLFLCAAAWRGARRKKGGCRHGEECAGAGTTFNSDVRGSCDLSCVCAQAHHGRRRFPALPPLPPSDDSARDSGSGMSRGCSKVHP